VKRYIAIALAVVILCLVLTGCKEESVEVSSLSDFEGWWCRPDGYKSDKNAPLSDTVSIVAADRMLTCYSRYGTAGSKYSCSAEGDLLSVAIDATGTVTLKKVDTTLVDPESGEVEYVKGKPIEAFDASVFHGSWYKNGDPNSDFYSVGEGGYSFCYGHIPGILAHAGAWTSESAVRYTSGGIGYEEVILLLSNAYADETFRAEYELALLCGGLVLYDNLTSEFYVRESAIKTDAGKQAIKEMVLVTEEWVADGEGAPYIKFGYYASGIEIVRPGDSGISCESLGKWRLDGDTLHIEYTDGTRESVSFSGASITLSHLGKTFSRDGN